MKFDVIAFDADDTLWQNETLFAATKDKFKALLNPYCSPETIQEQLDHTEIRNLRYFGYGIKGFTLSMIETAIQLTDGHIRGSEIQKLIEFGKAMLTTPIKLFDHVEQVLTNLARSYTLMLVTKGDLFDQESKLARSGLSRYFTYVEILSEKDATSYRTLLQTYHIPPERFLMVGNSLRSDILPVIEIGARTVYIPYDITWSHENIFPENQGAKGYYECCHIGEVPELLHTLEQC
ncbi:haloacid dehalogenase domain protein hydrolase [Candidatus Vecturithrix granuli]|uniref:Haloacid dehalogenase domain protein hydrolase n=1 Tax=Vecturithrix granuli TaxID=1499967 RepID=A0A0S6WA80_VECG1|nr:haloacid dehalogenase domain protein hydrolase [Candidatus Vecturithrix granuli]